MGEVRVRFAPSPTGHLHIGSARTALFNWLFARHHGGVFVLRIEDTDRQRSSEDYLKSILSDLRWIGLNWDEGPEVEGALGPYRQMERLDIYREYADKLIAAGRAYPCYCTPEELSAGREEAQKAGLPSGYDGRCRELSAAERARREAEGRRPALRFRVVPGRTIIDDVIRGQVEFDNALIEDFIIMKSDGIPVYNFAATVDDSLMKITHILRGEEHLSNTPRQIMVYEALGFEKPRFAHMTIILNDDRTKLSKREGATHLADFRERGFLPEALVNFLALLGWAPSADREIVSLAEIVREFNLPDVSSHPAIFNEQKLDWINSQYIKNLTPADLARLSLPFFQRENLIPETPSPADLVRLEKLSGIYSERLRTLAQFPKDADWAFRESIEYEPESRAKYLEKDSVPEALSRLAEKLSNVEPFGEAPIEESLRSLAGEMGISAGKLIHPSRVAITGRSVSPGIFEVMAIMGKEETIRRLNEARKTIQRSA
ncbi:MAG: glutamate--tRNA ligase [bacterium]